MQWFRLSRRALLQGTAALGLAAAARPRLARAQDAGVLRVRSYSDLQVLDPAHRKAQPEGDIMRCIYTKLIEYGPATNGAGGRPERQRSSRSIRRTSSSRCGPASGSPTASAR